MFRVLGVYNFAPTPKPNIAILNHVNFTMTKLSFTTFASCELLRRVYLQDATDVNESFAMLIHIVIIL